MATASAASASKRASKRRAGDEGDQSPVVLAFPISGVKAGEADTWELRQAYVDELAETFEGVDVHAECRKALGWVRSKPGRKKTRRGMKAFLFGWMGREQDRGGRRRDVGGRRVDRGTDALPDVIPPSQADVDFLFGRGGKSGVTAEGEVTR